MKINKITFTYKYLKQEEWEKGGKNLFEEINSWKLFWTEEESRYPDLGSKESSNQDETKETHIKTEIIIKITEFENKERI